MAGIFPQSIQQGLVVPAEPTKIAQDLLDFAGSGVVQSARYVNPVTHDFELDSNGKFLGENATDQSVWIALVTRFNSSSVPGLGNNINRITVPVIGPNIKNQMTALLNQCLSSLISNGFIKLGSISVTQPATNDIVINFVYFNVSLGQTSSVSFTFNGGNIQRLGP